MFLSIISSTLRNLFYRDTCSWGELFIMALMKLENWPSTSGEQLLSHNGNQATAERVGKLSMCCCVQAGNHVDGIQLLVRGQRQDGGKGAANMLSAWRNHPGGKHRGDWGRSRLTELCPLVSEQCEWTTRLIKEIDVFRQPLGCPDPGD